MLTYCEKRRMGIIPRYSLVAGDLSQPGGPLWVLSRRHRAIPGQIVSAWSLERSSVGLPIPGTSNVADLDEVVVDPHLTQGDESLGASRAALRP